MDDGEFRCANPAVVVRSLVMPLMMMCVHRHTIGACAAVDPLPDGPTFIREHVELLLQGLAVSPTTEASSMDAKSRHRSRISP